MSDPVQPHRWQPTRFPRPWDSPGQNTGVGCHFLLQCMKVKSESEVSQSCPTLSDPMDCSLPGSSIHGIFQARVLEWGAIAFSGLPWLGLENLERKWQEWTSLSYFCSWRKCFQLFTSVYDASCLSVTHGLKLRWGRFSLVPLSGEVIFLNKWVLDFVKSFFPASIEMII